MVKNLRIKIIKAAINTGAKKGIERIHVKEVAAKCKVTSAAMYYHFTNKYHLLVESTAYIVSQLNEIIAEQMELHEGIEPKYKASLKAVSEYALDNRDAAVFYSRMVIMPTIEIKKKDLNRLLHNYGMIKLLNTGIEEGQIMNYPYIMTIAYHPLWVYLMRNFVNKQDIHKTEIDVLIDVLWKAISCGEDKHLKPN